MKLILVIGMVVRVLEKWVWVLCSICVGVKLVSSWICGFVISNRWVG